MGVARGVQVRRPEPLVAVRHPTDRARPTMIPASRYDPSVHELWRDGVARVPDDVPEAVHEVDHLHDDMEG